MRIVEPSYKIMTPIDGIEILKKIERIARTCYQSEEKMTEYSAPKLVSMLIANGHEAMIEHHSITVKFICDRGISHEIVRHRIGSYAQESSRYCSYDKGKFGHEITVVRPTFQATNNINALNYLWEVNCKKAEKSYFELRDNGATAQEARSVLPTCLKTEIVCTYDLRTWRTFFKLRTSKAAHPDMRKLVLPLLKVLQARLPEIFGDIEVAE